MQDESEEDEGTTESPAASAASTNAAARDDEVSPLARPGARIVPPVPVLGPGAVDLVQDSNAANQAVQAAESTMSVQDEDIEARTLPSEASNTITAVEAEGPGMSSEEKMQHTKSRALTHTQGGVAGKGVDLAVRSPDVGMDDAARDKQRPGGSSAEGRRPQHGQSGPPEAMRRLHGAVHPAQNVSPLSQQHCQLICLA